MKIGDKLTSKIAENVGKIVFGEKYKLDELSCYPNGFRITHRTNSQTQFLHVEYEPYRVYITDFKSLYRLEELRVFTYLQKELGVEVLLPDYIK